MRIPAILRTPLLHFLLVGALLFVASAPSRRIAIDAERVDEIRRELGARAGRPPSRVELERLDALELDEELLYREALARGLAANDPGIEARLVQKMLFLDEEASLADAPALARRARALGLDREDFVIRRLLAEKLRLLATALEPAEMPDENALKRAWLDRRETLRTPTRRSLIHVFLSRDRRGRRAQADADALRRRIAARGTAPIASIGLGDPFPAGHALAARSLDELARQFGEDFAERVAGLPIGSWSEPIASAYGLHLVWVDAITAGTVPAFEVARERIRLELENDLRDRKLAALLAELRTRYEVAVAWSGKERE